MGKWVVTGANRGIGLELCRCAKKHNHDVLAVCRKRSPELDALGVTVVEGVDVTADDAAQKIIAALGSEKIDVLVNNAGILEPNSLGALGLESIRRQFEVNALAPLTLTNALVSRLGRGSKVALVTSRMASISDNGSGGMYGYRMSKAALNAAGVSLARDLKSHGIAVAILHPGYVRTGMTGNNGSETPDAAAEKLLARIGELDDKRSGRFYHVNGEELPW